MIVIKILLAIIDFVCTTVGLVVIIFLISTLCGGKLEYSINDNYHCYGNCVKQNKETK